jgi:methyl-accepting chemotaxis protein
MGKLIDKILKLRTDLGSDVHNIIAKDFVKLLNNNNEFMSNSTKRDIYPGKFYFLFYGLKEKLSKMEKYSPVYVVDIKRNKNKTIIYAISTNFLPIAIRSTYFDTLLSSYDETKMKNSEVLFKNINYKIAYNTLSVLGFEYVIREFEMEKLDSVKEIHNNYLAEFLLFNTQIFTDVGEDKLNQIWLAKLKTRDERHRKLMLDLMKDYKDMSKVILDTITQTTANIQQSYKELNTIINTIKQ